MTRTYRNLRGDGCTCGNRPEPDHEPGCTVRPMQLPDPQASAMLDLVAQREADDNETASDGGEL